MKIRTIYFKSPDMEKSRTFWQSFTGIEPHKSSDFWTEFKLNDINFSLLKMEQ